MYLQYLLTSADGLATYILLAMQMNLNSPVQEGNYMINLVHVYALKQGKSSKAKSEGRQGKKH